MCFAQIQIRWLKFAFIKLRWGFIFLTSIYHIGLQQFIVVLLYFCLLFLVEEIEMDSWLSFLLILFLRRTCIVVFSIWCLFLSLWSLLSFNWSMNSIYTNRSACSQLFIAEHVRYTVVTTISVRITVFHWPGLPIRVHVANRKIVTGTWYLFMHPEMSVQFNIFLLVSDRYLWWVTM